MLERVTTRGEGTRLAQKAPPGTAMIPSHHALWTVVPLLLRQRPWPPFSSALVSWHLVWCLSKNEQQKKNICWTNKSKIWCMAFPKQAGNWYLMASLMHSSHSCHKWSRVTENLHCLVFPAVGSSFCKVYLHVWKSFSFERSEEIGNR